MKRLPACCNLLSLCIAALVPKRLNPSCRLPGLDYLVLQLHDLLC